MIRALDRKLLRDLSRMKTQAFAISLVVASGVALFIATFSTNRSLRLSQERYYAENRFAQVWAHLARAPAGIVRDIAALPGVAAVEGRILSAAILDVPGVEEPATGLMVSIPPQSGHALNDIHVRRGRHVEPGRAGEVLVSEAFAETNRLGPGSTLFAVVAGHRLELHVVGVALSPEHVMQVAPGALVPDDRRFGVFWMERDQLAALLDLREAVNEVALRLSRGASEASVIAQLDALLAPYGGLGAYGRKSQLSHVQLEDHIEQLAALALIVPTIFLLVAAFLVNVVLSRLIGTQRMQVGMLKAFGYSNRKIATHYLKLALTIVALGIATGLPVGAWLGHVMATFYATFFRFPVLVFSVEPGVVALGTGVTILASAAGTLGSLRSVATMPPIVAMLPAAPVYRPGAIDRLGIARWLAPGGRMILRNVTRRPARAVLTTTGMALAVAILVLGNTSADSITRAIDVQFQTAQREDVSVTLAHARSLGAARDFVDLPGVRTAEPFRAIAARVRVAAQSQDVRLLGLAPESKLRRIVDGNFQVLPPPPDGVLVGAWLAQRLGIHRGDKLAIELRERERRIVTPRVVGVVDEPLGATVYMQLAALGRLLDEPERFSGANLRIDPRYQSELYSALKRSPEALAVEVRRGTLANFRSMTDTTLRFIRRIEILFSVIIAFGVVYNGARIALAERGYELATLRVLGFRRGEVSMALLGEVGLLALPAVPLGFGLGYGLAAWVATAMSNERLHMPKMVLPGTYALAVLVFAAAALASALLVRRQLDRLDLIAVLKARE